jgi:hypothetical protein
LREEDGEEGERRDVRWWLGGGRIEGVKERERSRK